MDIPDPDPGTARLPVNFRPPATSATRLAIIQATATDQIIPFTQQVPTATVIPTLTAELTPTVTATVTLTPTPTEPPPVRFAVIGDYGEAGPHLQAVAEMVLGWEPDFILTTGDNNYPNGTAELIDENIGQYFHTYIYPYQGSYGPGAESNRFFPTLGNHDWNTDGAQPYLDYFTLPGNERYYDFTWGPLHFFALNSDSREPDGVGKSSVQAAWLKEELEDSTLPWQIIYGHYPPFSSGFHGSTDWMYWPFTEWGADVVLSGHDHTYERLQVEGMLHFIVGLSGASRSTFSTPHPGSLVRYNSQFGALLVEATATQITFSFYNITGELVDTYTLLAER
jgi:hypothetical protein